MNITKKYSFYYDYTGFYGYTDSSHEIEAYNINQNILLKDFFSIEDLDDNDIYQKQQEAEDYIYESYYDQHQCYHLYDFNIRFAHFILETGFDYYIEYIDKNGNLICIEESIYFDFYDSIVEQYGERKLSDLKDIILNDKDLQESILHKIYYYFTEILKFEIK